MFIFLVVIGLFFFLVVYRVMFFFVMNLGKIDLDVLEMKYVFRVFYL